jgi:hypothetical protein
MMRVSSGLWRLVDFKYRTQNPNVLSCADRNESQFWKHFMWAAEVARMGYNCIDGR